jgi:hypothetical protein
MKKTIPTILSVFLLFISCCATTGGYEQASSLAQLQVLFADSSWDGRTIPNGQQCKKFGGKGATPRLIVKNIPAEANAVIMEYSDKDYLPMDNGGHGIVGYKIAQGKGEVNIPSVPGHTFSLPEGFFVVSAHSNPAWDTAGAYMPPCSGGKSHVYYVTVKAVYQPASKDQKQKLLGTGKLILGNY